MKIKLIMVICASLLLAGCAATRKAPPAKVAHYRAEYHRPYPGNVTPEPCEAATSSPATRHTVRGGETLWSIAKTYNVDINTLAKANSIRNKRSISVGQVLVIPHVKSSYGNGYEQLFSWPVKGYIASRFGEKVDMGLNKGIDIKAAEGSSVVASRAGKVVYRDLYLKGFGMTVIIDHLDGYQTVYSYNSDILVNVGDMVRQNQSIARVGQSGRAKEPMLHFEIRKNGVPEDPSRYL